MEQRAGSNEQRGVSGATSPWSAAGRTELGVEEGYRLWSRVYDDEANALIVIEEPVVDRWLDSIVFADALDAGAGTGRHALRLAARGARTTAVDASAEMLAVARSKAAERGLQVHFDEAKLDRLPYTDASFDLVICSLVLTHYADPGLILRELARVIRPGGHVIVTDFHPDIVAAGARTSFRAGGDRYVLPNPGPAVEDYVLAIATAGLIELERVELPLSDSPPEMVSAEFRRTFEGRLLCLALLARRPVND